MLELDVLEQRPLESSVSRTVTPWWPVLHVPFILDLKIGPDPISDLGNLDQLALQANVQETRDSLTESSEDTKDISAPELVSCASEKDTGELFILNSAVMLDVVEKVTPMEICDSTENMMLQEAGESSNLRIREDFFEITIARDLTNQLPMKDNTLSNPVSKMNDNAAGREVMGTGAVLQSEQSERMGNLPNDPNKVESLFLAAIKPQTLIEESTEEFLHGECTMSMSSSYQCTAYNTRDGDSVKCLEAEHLPCLQSTSTQRTIDPVDFPVPASLQETSVCKDPGFSCINEVGTASCFLQRLDPNTCDDINAPKENSLQRSVPRDTDLNMSVESIPQEFETTVVEKQKNTISTANLTKTDSVETASTRLQDVQSDTSKVDLLLCDKSMLENSNTSSENFEDDPSFKPNLPPCIENLTGAKALDTEECSFSSNMSDCNTSLSDDAPDCQTKYTCANNLEDRSDPSPHNVLFSAPPSGTFGESSRANSSIGSSDCVKTSYIDFNSDTTGSGLDGEIKEQLFRSGAPLNDKNVRITEHDINSRLSMETEEKQCTIPQKLHQSEGTGKLVFIQLQGLCDKVPALAKDSITSLKVVEESPCLVDTDEDSSGGIYDSDSVIHDVTNCDGTVNSSHMQSNLAATIKEAVLTSDYLKVPCPTVGYFTDETPSYALVPYIDIWGSFSNPEVNSLLSSKEPKNIISQKVESPELKKDEDEFKGSDQEGHLLNEPPKFAMKDRCILKALKNPQEVDLSHCGGKYKVDETVLDSSSKMDTLLAQEVKFNVSAVSFPECHSIKMHDHRISKVPSTINQPERICYFNSGAVCDSSVPLDVSNMSVLPQLVDIRSGGDTLQSQHTNVCFLKEYTPRLSVSNKHLGDCSALLLPTSSPACAVALTDFKNREESRSEVCLGNLHLHVTNNADPSVQILDDTSKSFTLKQDTRHITTLESFNNPCMQTSATEVNGPQQSMQPDVLDENTGPFMMPMDRFLTHEREPSPGKAVAAIQSKATRVKSQRNVLRSEIKIHEKSLKNYQLLKERPRQSAGCHQEMLSGTTVNREKYNLRPAPQSLNCSTSQEAKRPKISNGKDVVPGNSGLLNCVEEFSQKSKSHHLAQSRQACKRKEPPCAIGNSSSSSLGTGISIKRQPNRKCKGFPARENLPTNIETQTCESLPVLEMHMSHDISVEYKPLPSKYVDLNRTSMPTFSKMSRGRSVSQKSTHLLILNKLSRIANRLTAPSKDSCTSKTFSSNLKVIPFCGVKIQARKLLSVFTCVNMSMDSQPGQIWQENVCLPSSRDRLVSQSMNLYPTSFPKTCSRNLGDPFSLNSCGNLTFPVSFHVNLDPICLSDFLKCNPPDYILRSPPTTAQSSEISEWTLSLFLSSHVPTDPENVHLLTQWNPQFRSLWGSESSHTRRSVRKSGCSMLGLHTVLALSSPGCYRLWTRRRNLGSRIPTVQKLSVAQFAHGLKGSPPQFSRENEQFSSLAFSLGRVLSTWSRHGLSAFSSDCANTRPNCSVWLPCQSRKVISLFQNLNLPLKQRICHQKDLGLPFYLSTQQKDDPRPLCWLSSPYKKDVELSSCSFKQEDGPRHSFIFSTVKEYNSNLLFDPLTRQKSNPEHPLCLSSLQHDLKPVINISLKKDQNPTICLDSRCDVSIQKDVALDLHCPVTPPKGQACPFEQRENILIPCKQSQNKEGDQKGAFKREPQRVSQIRIRKTIPKPDPNLTPMGLPKPKRVNKKEFSLEDIYTNKNYKSPPPARSLETIFEEPKEKNGVLISVSKQKRKRVLDFRDCTVPRLKRPKGKVKVMSSCKRGRKAAIEGVQLDALLIQKLMDLENCLLEEEARERGSAASEMPS
ncbi:protein PRR14L isoform X2 [Rhinoderma darwinii]|uniref:protein PRR14L isoform X2 n=1 Tax=Rhinoderma darwinii TaxID=43563 RepID=UPI003F673B81